LWDGATGAEVARLEGHIGELTAITFSPDGSMLATGSTDHQVRLWDTKTGAEHPGPPENGAAIERIGFSFDGSKLVATSNPGLQLWDIESHELTPVADVVGKPIVQLSVSPGYPRIAAQIDDITFLWDANTGTRVAQFEGMAMLAFSGDGSQLATLDSELVVWLWHGEDGTFVDLVDSFAERGGALEILNSGNRLTLAHGDAVTIWTGGLVSQIDEACRLLKESGDPTGSSWGFYPGVRFEPSYALICGLRLGRH
jgi:WD40 repeat protein